MYDILTQNNIRGDLELCRFGKQKTTQGNPLVMNFFMGRDEGKRKSIIATAWKILGATSIISRSNKKRLQILQEVLLGDCICKSDGEWLKYAKETLTHNKIEIANLSAAV